MDLNSWFGQVLADSNPGTRNCKVPITKYFYPVNLCFVLLDLLCLMAWLSKPILNLSEWVKRTSFRNFIIHYLSELGTVDMCDVDLAIIAPMVVTGESFDQRFKWLSLDVRVKGLQEQGVTHCLFITFLLVSLDNNVELDSLI